jgi:hypothetical protein
MLANGLGDFVNREIALQSLTRRGVISRTSPMQTKEAGETGGTEFALK